MNQLWKSAKSVRINCGAILQTSAVVLYDALIVNQEDIWKIFFVKIKMSINLSTKYFLLKTSNF
ncbi:hypothetical protein BpHYR1_042050 [Brachionus plicatilis]|uniref:Uncharacterized protein n=1 Tax=Brachionus plicatilis TaxID=10195 RepID=A0A3M7R1I9_BRAPC|nr:hypothetical protein BpHYR1_042050 [Brachionus plicatilis]